MRSTFYGMEVARSGLYTSQNELNITGHNISNVDTVGYTRQRLETAALPALAINNQFAIDSRSTAGRGVTTVVIEQIRSAFLDRSYRTEASATGYSQVRADEFYMVELIFNNTLEQGTSTASVTNALSAFYTALNAMAEETTNSKDIRTVLQDAGNKLADTLNYTYGKLEEQYLNVDEQIKVTVDEINDIADAISNLNRQIYGYELTGARANDLRDQRNLLLDELSGKLDIEYFENGKGHLIVTINGRRLVDGVTYNRLAVDPNGAVNKLDEEGGIEPPGGVNSIAWEDDLGLPSQSPQDIVVPTGGELEALFDIRDGDTETNMGIPFIARQLNDLCRKIAREVNEVHRSGYTMPYTEADSPGTSASLYIHSMTEQPDGTFTTDVYADGSFAWLAGNNLVEDPVTGTFYYPSTNGVDFFYSGLNDDYKTITAKTFRVSDEVAANPYLIATSTVPMTIPDDGYPQSNQFYGNTVNISNILQLYDKKDALGHPDNFESKLTSIVTTVAEEQGHLESLNKAQKIRIEAIVAQRSSLSDVSLDEEMTNIIRFTHAYNAASRIITAIDDELDTLINRMGRVGL